MVELDGHAALVPPRLRSANEDLEPRQWLLDEIDRWYEADERLLLISGGGGTGKTALCLQALMRDAETRAQDSGASRRKWAGSYFCSQRLPGFSVHPRQFVSHLQHSILLEYPEAFASLGPAPHAINISASVHAGSVAGSATAVNLRIDQLKASPMSIADYFQVALVEPITFLSRSALKVGIIIDGLDEADKLPGNNIFNLLVTFGTALPETCRLLVTTQNRKGIIASLLEAFPDSRHIDLSSPAGRIRSDDDIRRYVSRKLVPEGQLRDIAAIEVICGASAGNFLHAKSLLLDHLGGRDATRGMPPGVTTYYRDALLKLKLDAEDDASLSWVEDCLPVLRLLCVAAAPLGRKTLQALTDLSPSRVKRAVNHMDRLLQVGDHDGAIALDHGVIAEVLMGAGELPDGDRFGEADEETLLEDMLHKIARLRAVRDGDWNQADVYVRQFASAHMLRLASIAPGRLRSVYRSLRVVSYAASVVEEDYQGGRQAQIVTELLRTCFLLGQLQDLTVIASSASQSASPLIRSAVADELAEISRSHAPLATRALRDLLQVPSRNAWVTALNALDRMDPDPRDEVIAWIAGARSDALREQASHTLYALWRSSPVEIPQRLLGLARSQVRLLHPLRSRRVLEFIAATSVTAYVNHCDVAGMADATSDLWAFILKRCLRADRVNRPFTRPMLKVVAGHLAQRSVTNPFIQDDTWSRPVGDADHVERLLAGLSPDTDFELIQDDVGIAFDSDQWVPKVIAATVFAVHAYSSFQGNRTRFEDMFRRSSGRSRLWQIASLTILLANAPADWIELLEQETRTVVSENRADYVAAVQTGDFTRVNLVHTALGLAYGKAETPMRIFPELLRSWRTEEQARHIVNGLGIVGFFYPENVLDCWSVLVAEFPEFSWRDILSSSLAQIYTVHPENVDVFADQTGIDRTALRVGRGKLNEVSRHFNAIGMFNSAVNQAVSYPKMRNEWLIPAYRGLATSATPREFIAKFTPTVLSLLDEADYELIKWTR